MSEIRRRVTRVFTAAALAAAVCVLAAPRYEAASATDSHLEGVLGEITGISGDHLVVRNALGHGADSETIQIEPTTRMLSGGRGALHVGAPVVNGDTAASLATPVAVTTTATLLSPSGTYPIVASGAADPNYTVAFVNGTLTVTGLQSVAQGVRTAIAGLEPAGTQRPDHETTGTRQLGRENAGSRQLDHEIDAALRQIDASLQSRLWEDDSHLTEKGQFVFEAARKAVSELTEHEIAKRAPADLVSQLAAQANILVQVNRGLAELPLDEATAAGVDARRLADPTQDIADGDTQAAKPGGGDEAIQRYRDAWQDVQKAVRALTHDADHDADRDHARTRKGDHKKAGRKPGTTHGR
jgi:hypothetical protein